MQLTSIVGSSNGPSLKGGNCLINLPSIGAGDSRASGGTWCATVFLANNSASQGMVTGNCKYGILDSRVQKNLPKLKSVQVIVKVIFQMGSNAGESTSSPRCPWILSSSALQLHDINEWCASCKGIYRRLTRIQASQPHVQIGMLDFVYQSTPSYH